ncbi:hypothetical protein NZD89_18145 [Alicyclobacillus fastidiosus]|uniref:Uncharacterized protein n=1 Tax=Alicyclobacillus fastidiosus TaxID=392011 RepID=A0ABY6ZDF5_9BACL|nr:hypothetical protein [Alicyclobacillus fastidiosus]WAH40281.1 hypothetical protein NZD89_18145 [Alicyclobacillus fastidiosus]
MALTQLPTVKPPKGTIYATAIVLATFLFFFTRAKTGAGTHV